MAEISTQHFIENKVFLTCDCKFANETMVQHEKSPSGNGWVSFVQCAGCAKKHQVDLSIRFSDWDVYKPMKIIPTSNSIDGKPWHKTKGVNNG